MKTYQIYASSIQGYGADIAEQEYRFAWEIIPDGEYEMSWSLISKATKLTEALSQVESIVTHIDIQTPFTTDRYKVNKATGYAVSTSVAGFITYHDSPNHNGHLMRQYRASAADNAAVVLRGKPSGNSFYVRCLNTAGTLGTMFNYDLVVTLKRCECSK